MRWSRGSRQNLIDRLDARAVMLHCGVVAVLAFVLSSPLFLAALVVGVWLLVAAAGLLRECRPQLIAGASMAAAIVVANPLVSREGSTLLLRGPILPVIGRFTVSAEAVVFGFAMGLRLLAVLGAFALYSTALDADATARLLSRISFGSALIVALAARLFPAMTRDATRIADAQRCRGARLDGGSTRQRILARRPLLDSLLLTSLERAVQIAESMESRGYGRKPRSRLPLARWQPKDWLVAGGSLISFALGLSLAIGGVSSFEYYPALRGSGSGLAVAYAVAFASVLAAPSLLVRGWDKSAWLRSRI